MSADEALRKLGLRIVVSEDCPPNSVYLFGDGSVRLRPEDREKFTVEIAAKMVARLKNVGGMETP